MDIYNRNMYLKNSAKRIITRMIFKIAFVTALRPTPLENFNFTQFDRIILDG